MGEFEADRVVDSFVSGRLTRRGLIERLMILGALSAAGGSGRASEAEDAKSTFSAQALDHIALSVTNVGRSADWYVRHLGLRVTSRSAESAFLGCPGGDFLALFQGADPGLHHYSFAIQNYDQQAAAQRLRDAGLTPKPRGGRMYFDDPDGIEVQVSQA